MSYWSPPESPLLTSPTPLSGRLPGTETVRLRIALFLGEDSKHSSCTQHFQRTEAAEKRPAAASVLGTQCPAAALLALVRAMTDKILYVYLLHCSSCLLET